MGMEMAKPQAEHQWLQRLVGEWTSVAEAKMGPDKPVEQFKGKERVRAIGGLWIVAEGEGEMPGGGTANMILTLGFDPQKNTFVGTWLGSMMTNLWVYDGTLEGNILTLRTIGPDMVEQGKTANYREVIELKSDDLRTFTSSVQGSDGNWTQIMTSTYRRVR